MTPAEAEALEDDEFDAFVEFMADEAREWQRRARARG